MDILATLARIVLDANLRALVAALAVAIACLLLGRFLAPHWRSWLWLLVFVPLAIPFAPPSPVSLYNLFAVPDDTPPITSKPNRNFAQPLAAIRAPAQPATIGNEPAVETAASAPPFPWGLALSIAWITGAALLLLRLIASTWRVRRTLKRLPPLQSAQVLECVATCAREVGVRRVREVVLSSDGAGPAIAGIFRPVLMLPAGLAETISPAQLRLVLLHELRHARAGDLLFNWLLNLLTAIHWPNPAAWYAHRQWLTERELACDGWVTNHAGDTGYKPYAETLLRITELTDDRRALPLTAGITSQPSFTERRILAMKTPRNATWFGFVVGCCLVGFIAAVGLTERARGDDDGHANSNSAARNTPEEEVIRPSPRKEDVHGTSQLDPNAVKPIIVFTKHLILWGPRVNEAITWEEMDKRLTRLAKNDSVHPQFMFTNGSKFSSGEGFQEIQDRILKSQITGELPKFDAVSFGFVAPAAGERLDPIETPKELKPDPADRITGTILLPDGQSPAAGAQVIVVAPEVEHRGPLPITIVHGRLRSAVDESWAPTDAQGQFIIYPNSTERAIAVLHPKGFLYLPAPIDRDVENYTLIPWATIKIDASQLGEDERFSLRIHPKGSEGSAGFSVYLSEHRQEDEPVTTIKIPPGRVMAGRGIELDQGTTISELVHKLSMKPGEKGKYRVPSTSPEDREELKEHFRRNRKHQAELRDLREELEKQESRDRIERAKQQLSQ